MTHTEWTLTFFLFQQYTVNWLILTTVTFKTEKIERLLGFNIAYMDEIVERLKTRNQNLLKKPGDTKNQEMTPLSDRTNRKRKQVQ